MPFLRPPSHPKPVPIEDAAARRKRLGVLLCRPAPDVDIDEYFARTGHRCVVAGGVFMMKRRYPCEAPTWPPRVLAKPE